MLKQQKDQIRHVHVHGFHISGYLLQRILARVPNSVTFIIIIITSANNFSSELIVWNTQFKNECY